MGKQEIINQNGYIAHLGIVEYDFNGYKIVFDNGESQPFKGLYKLVEDCGTIYFKNVYMNIDNDVVYNNIYYKKIILTFYKRLNYLIASFWFNDVFYGSITINEDDTIRADTL